MLTTLIFSLRFLISAFNVSSLKIFVIPVVASTNSSVAGLKTELTDGSTIVKTATQDGSGNVITTTYETKSDAAAKLTEAKSYADGIKEILLNNSSEAIDSIFELRDAMTDNAEAIEALTEIAGSKAPAVHTHTKNEITDFPTSLPASDVSEWAKATSKPSYTASEVGALPSTTVIPTALAALTEDATHRVVTDTEKAAWNAKSNFSGNYNDLTNKPTIPSIVGLATEEYVNNAVANKEFILNSTTEGSTKKFRVTVDDTGVLTAVEVAE